MAWMQVCWGVTLSLCHRILACCGVVCVAGFLWRGNCTALLYCTCMCCCTRVGTLLLWDLRDVAFFQCVVFGIMYDTDVGVCHE